ncbi:MAG: bacteriohemerythrin, partial [Rhodospirillaceae bacterium]
RLLGQPEAPENRAEAFQTLASQIVATLEHRIDLVDRTRARPGEDGQEVYMNPLEILFKDLVRILSRWSTGPLGDQVGRACRDLDVARARLVEAEGRDELYQGSGAKLIEHPAAPVPWTIDRSVGVPLLDEHHRIMMVLIARLRLAVHDSGDRGAARSLFEDLRVFTAWHFAMELTMAQAIRPEGALALRIEQAGLMADLEGTAAAFDRDSATQLVDLLEPALVHWMRDHLSQTARALGFS